VYQIYLALPIPLNINLFLPNNYCDKINFSLCHACQQRPASYDPSFKGSGRFSRLQHNVPTFPLTHKHVRAIYSHIKSMFLSIMKDESHGNKPKIRSLQGMLSFLGAFSFQQRQISSGIIRHFCVKTIH